VESRYLRIAYAVQYVVTLIAIFAIWAQVGGQYHLDLMPWYWKLLLACALSLAAVKATAAAVQRDRFRNGRTMGWLAAALALIATMGILSYYEHLHEPADDEEEPATRVDIT
jgi:heme/copper-type cytochrome/quinol oxidase subunit 3